MQSNETPQTAMLPLSGCRVLERSDTVAAAYAGRMLAALGAQVVMLEPPGGSRLRQAPPLIDGGESALFAYLAVGKRSLAADLSTPSGRALLERELACADILIDDTPVREREALGLSPQAVSRLRPDLVHVSVLPFGAAGPKADWDGDEVNLLHAGGEGFLLPNGLSHELFPDRPPLKIYGHFGGYQGGAMAAFCALSAWWAVPAAGGQYVDVSVQDAVLSVGAFALQRLGDGSLEHRTSRRFRYGGVFEAQDGFIELLTLEDRQWASLVQLLGSPAWAADPGLGDPLERSRRGDEINGHIREWMARHPVEDIVRRAQELGVPAAKYRLPAEVVDGEQERARGLFAPAELASGQEAGILVAPFQFRCTPLPRKGRVPALDEMAQEASA
ncbi:CaiB/BaiF CoA transferase family protein [Achromobacter arsenitoxydans]|uniref:Acyl-CoA transferase/carnitine dehydratase n=1 Tax=Achromobacter arsenitoxydans SY8 TaxID=477184 RepID=H0F6P2_9BURK|nr:CoA transferase [Achromobacter arsenitoxydans]EHK66054.1 acyl-CoA transferase/carnitine dehydratase [Achromobacter arsenitoxydans SY8]